MGIPTGLPSSQSILTQRKYTEACIISSPGYASAYMQVSVQFQETVPHNQCYWGGIMYFHKHVGYQNHGDDNRKGKQHEPPSIVYAESWCTSQLILPATPLNTGFASQKLGCLPGRTDQKMLGLWGKQCLYVRVTGIKTDDSPYLGERISICPLL